MTKLEDIQLELGDKITFDGTILNVYNNVDYVRDKEGLDIRRWNTYHITKIERYTPIKDTNNNNTEYYFIKTIWEREEEPKEIEKLDIRISDNGTECLLDRFGTYCGMNKHTRELANKINELIDKVNELSKGE